MSNVVKFCLGLGLLSTFAHADFEILREKLNDAILSKTIFAGQFLLHKNAVFNPSADGLIYNGIRQFDKKNVVLKFMENERAAMREFEMYWYLKPIYELGTLEKFGFADVLHYGKWEGYHLLVLSNFHGDYLSPNLMKSFFNAKSSSYVINGLLLFRNFVRQSKLMHSRGIRHDNINPHNIMMQNCHKFLINFNSGSKIHEHNECGTPKYASRKYHRNETRTASCDWESFFYSMCDMYGIELDWFSNPDMSDGEYLRHKNDQMAIKRKIRESMEENELQIIFIWFTIELFKEDPFPNYDHSEELINLKIKTLNLHPKYANFWCMKIRKPFAEIREDESSEPQFSIEEHIVSPQSIDFRQYEYPIVNFAYFS